jgi:hypothetical protein
MYDLSGLEDGSGPMRYTATGEPVTPESEARYKKMADSFHSATMALYNAETAKGTDAADIFDKLVALGDSQSAEYRNVTNWEAKLG